MHGLGFLAFGASTGIITSMALCREKTRNSSGSILIALMPIFLSAAAVILHPQLSQSQFSDFYWIGLLASLFWHKTISIINELTLPPWVQISSLILNFFISLFLVIIALVLTYRG